MDFDLKQCLESGQCFRFSLNSDMSYTVFALGETVVIRQDNNGELCVDNTNDINKWQEYFDIDKDYGIIKEELSKDIVLKKAIKFGSGIRILKQDPWETIISFIISSNNNIPRIKKIVNTLCEISGGNFPTPKKLSEFSEKDLNPLKAGYRTSYILDAAQKINSKEVDIERIKTLKTQDARAELMKIKGVGPKIADCVLLFSFQRYEVYPIDVWIKRITEIFYFDGKEVSGKEILQFINNKFGELAGYAQQYLYYYARENKIK